MIAETVFSDDRRYRYVLVRQWSTFGHRVLTLLRAYGVVPHALMLNGDGSPRHPLYVPYERKPKAIRSVSNLGTETNHA